MIKAKFLISCENIRQCPSWGLPEIVLLGRSNVGKSTFINTLANHKGLAKTSNTPGKTRLINFFNFEDKFKTGSVHFVRIGENLGDIDDYSFGNPSDYISIIEQVDFNGIDKMIDIEEEI